MDSIDRQDMCHTYRAVVKEVVKEMRLCLSRTSCPHLPSTNHVNVELYGALCIVTHFERHTVVRYEAQFGLCMPPEASQLRHTINTEPPTTLSDQVNWLLPADGHK